MSRLALETNRLKSQTKLNYLVAYQSTDNNRIKFKKKLKNK